MNVQSSVAADMRQIVSFALGPEEYGVDISQVQEINRMVTITHVPRAPKFIEGVINLRGQLIPVIDLRKRFGLPAAEHSKNTRIVVTELEGKRIGLVVDSVSEVLRVPVDQIEQTPDVISSVDTAYIQGVAKIGDRLIVLLNLALIMSTTERAALESMEPAV